MDLEGLDRRRLYLSAALNQCLKGGPSAIATTLNASIVATQQMQKRNRAILCELMEVMKLS